MGTRHLTVAGLLASVLAVGLITGCGQGSGSPSAADSASGSPSAAPSASASGSPGASIAPQSPPPSTGASGSASGELTLTGPIETGAEPSCLILRANGGTYQLLGGDKNIVKAGNTVTVTGQIVTGRMSYCMQGKMFQVTQAHIN